MHDRPVPVALLIDGRWQPSILCLVAATAAEFGRAYAACWDVKRTADDWAVKPFFCTESFKDKLRMIESVLDTPGVSDERLRCLAVLVSQPDGDTDRSAHGGANTP